MGKAKLFEYYQPNDKDLKDQYGDCQIRALSKALNLTWLETYDTIAPICREAQLLGIFDAPAKVRNELVKKLGFSRPTVWKFAKEHPTGTYILNVANHEVACVDGKYFDTWDCGECSLYGFYTKL